MLPEQARDDELDEHLISWPPDDLPALPDDHDVVVVGQGVVLLR